MREPEQPARCLYTTYSCTSVRLLFPAWTNVSRRAEQPTEKEVQGGLPAKFSASRRLTQVTCPPFCAMMRDKSPAQLTHAETTSRKTEASPINRGQAQLVSNSVLYTGTGYKPDMSLHGKGKSLCRGCRRRARNNTPCPSARPSRAALKRGQPSSSQTQGTFLPSSPLSSLLPSLSSLVLRRRFDCPPASPALSAYEGYAESDPAEARAPCRFISFISQV